MADYSSVLSRIREGNVKGASARSGYYPLWWPPSGESVFRVLPPPPGGSIEDMVMPAAMHYNVGSRKMVFCPAGTGYDTENSRCPICEERIRLLDAGDKTRAKKYSFRSRYAMLVIVRGMESVGPQIFLAPVGVAESIFLFATMQDRYGDIFHMKDGRDLILSRTGEGLQTRYSVSPDGKTSPILPSKDATMELLKNLKPLASQIVPPSYEDLVAILEGREPNTDKAGSTPREVWGGAGPTVTTHEDSSWGDDDDDLPWETGSGSSSAGDTGASDDDWGGGGQEEQVSDGGEDEEDWVDPGLLNVASPPTAEAAAVDESVAKIRDKLKRNLKRGKR